MCKLTRCILILVNFLLFVMSVVSLGVGAYLLFSTKDGYVFIKETLGLPEIVNVHAGSDDNSIWVVKFAAWALVITGGFVGIVSFLGFFGAVKEWSNMLVTYALIITLMAIVKAIVLSILISKRGDLEKVLKDSMESALDANYVPLSSNYYRDEGSYLRYKSFTLFINSLQVYQNCCFFDPAVPNFKSKMWQASHPKDDISGQEISLPMACCPVQDDMRVALKQANTWLSMKGILQTDDCPMSGSGAYQTSCFGALAELLNAKIKLVYMLIGGLTGIEITLVVLTILYSITPDSNPDPSNYG